MTEVEGMPEAWEVVSAIGDLPVRPAPGPTGHRPCRPYEDCGASPQHRPALVPFKPSSVAVLL